MTIFGEKLKQARQDKKMLQEELAEKTGLSQASISQFEKGLRLPTPANIKKLADALDVEPEHLAGDNEGEFEKMALMRNLKDLSPATIKKINDIVEAFKTQDQKAKGRK